MLEPTTLDVIRTRSHRTKTNHITSFSCSYNKGMDSSVQFVPKSNNAFVMSIAATPPVCSIFFNIVCFTTRNAVVVVVVVIF